MEADGAVAYWFVPRKVSLRASTLSPPTGPEYTPTAMGRLYDRCVRCGVTVPWGHSVCRRCNPAGLPSPSPSQYHAFVFLAIAAVLAALTAALLLFRV